MGHPVIFGKKSAQKRADQAESWSGYATLLILAGILLEIALLFRFRHETSNWELSLLVAANAAIGIGLLVEFFCIHAAVKASRELKTESDAQLTEALDRAANAERELRDFRRPRRHLMTKENRDILIARLSPFAGTKFDTGLSPGGEPMHFLWDLEETLHHAKWNQLPWVTGVVGVQEVRRGLRPVAGSINSENVELHVHASHRNGLLPATNALIAALKEIGITAWEAPFNVLNTNAEAIHVLIGPKG
jgi:hypothetical protein